MTPAIDETGKRYGRLRVIERATPRGKRGARWKALCDCGKECEVIGCHLRARLVTSCGCWLRGSRKARCPCGYIAAKWQPGWRCYRCNPRPVVT